MTFTAVDSWKEAARAHLRALRNPDGGWPYRAGDESATEPTALAVLALMGSLADEGLPIAADWLEARQIAPGQFSASVSHQEASWLTPVAALALSEAGRVELAAAAADALLREPVFTFSQAGPQRLYGYDTTLAGWGWNAGTFSFVEPTAWSTIFLKRRGFGEDPRVREAATLLRDRALADGGWNYGEPEVLQGRLYPAEAPTALALLALSDERDAVVEAGAGWLRGRLGEITSLYSLGWSAIALARLDGPSEAWIAQVTSRWEALPIDRCDAVGTALSLIAVQSNDAGPFTTS